MMSVMTRTNSRRESLIVMAVMAGIIIPLRFLTVFMFGENWIGSLGVITAVTLVIIVLAKKRKLGRFGDMFIRAVTNLHEGKRRFIFFAMMAFMLIYATSAVTTIHLGNTTYYELKLQATGELSEMGIESYGDAMEATSSMTVEDHAKAAIEFPVLAVKEFATVSVTAAIVNDMMDGWYMYFASLILVESAEIIGLVVITKRYATPTEAI